MFSIIVTKMKVFLLVSLLEHISAAFHYQHVGSYSKRDVVFEERMDSKLACLQKSKYFGGEAVYEGRTCVVIKRSRNNDDDVEITSNNYMSTMKELPNDDCIEKEWRGLSLRGYNIAEIPHIDNKDACLRMCKENAYCRFWTWGTHASMCWIKTSDAGGSVLGKNKITGKVCQVKDCSDIVDQDTTYDSTNKRSFAVANADDCKNECRKEIDLSFWTFDKISKICSVKKSKGTPRKSSNHISGVVCKKNH